MTIITLELTAMVFYGLLSIGGGIMGYMKSQSKISLLSGGISGILLLILAGMMSAGYQFAATIAAVLIALLIIVFIMRWAKTKKLMPAFPMVFFGVVSIFLILN